MKKLLLVLAVSLTLVCTTFGQTTRTEKEQDRYDTMMWMFNWCIEEDMTNTNYDVTNLYIKGRNVVKDEFLNGKSEFTFPNMHKRLYEETGLMMMFGWEEDLGFEY